MQEKEHSKHAVTTIITTGEVALKIDRMAPADLSRIDTWIKYIPEMCISCNSSCCKLPVEVKIPDLIRMEVIDEFESEEPIKNISKKLKKQGIVKHVNTKSGIFTLEQHSNGDCYFLDNKTRLCTIYDKRPNTCRNHPKVGPRPGFCAYVNQADA